MATTTNYGWTTPDDTALVKDGASAIRSLGSAIDTSMFTTNKAGLVHINTTSFSAVASQSINDVFSSTYDNYRIVLEIASASGCDLNFRYRVSGADNSTANYHRQYISGTSTTVAAARTGSATSYGIATLDSNRNFIIIDLANPFLTVNTSGIINSSEKNSSGTNIGALFFVLGFGIVTGKQIGRAHV